MHFQHPKTGCSKQPKKDFLCCWDSKVLFKHFFYFFYFTIAPNSKSYPHDSPVAPFSFAMFWRLEKNTNFRKFFENFENFELKNSYIDNILPFTSKRSARLKRPFFPPCSKHPIRVFNRGIASRVETRVFCDISHKAF